MMCTLPKLDSEKSAISYTVLTNNYTDRENEDGRR